MFRDGSPCWRPEGNGMVKVVLGGTASMGERDQVPR